MALAQRTLDLVNIDSVSGNEAEAFAYVEACVPLETAFTDGESAIYAKRAGKPLVLLAGHTDTVPAQGNLPGRLENGAVAGLGASDMKGGLAVMIELARWAAGAELGRDLALLFFPREELGPAENPLPAMFARAPLVDELRAAGGFEVQPKQAWTNVADFAARGLDAVNLGPGGTRYAHAADERVEVAELARTFEALRRFLA